MMPSPKNNLAEMAQILAKSGMGGDDTIIHIQKDQLPAIAKILGHSGKMNKKTRMLSFAEDGNDGGTPGDGGAAGFGNSTGGEGNDPGTGGDDGVDTSSDEDIDAAAFGIDPASRGKKDNTIADLGFLGKVTSNDLAAKAGAVVGGLALGPLGAVLGGWLGGKAADAFSSTDSPAETAGVIGRSDTATLGSNPSPSSSSTGGGSNTGGNGSNQNGDKGSAGGAGNDQTGQPTAGPAIITMPDLITAVTTATAPKPMNLWDQFSAFKMPTFKMLNPDFGGNMIALNLTPKITGNIPMSGDTDFNTIVNSLKTVTKK